MVTGIRDSETDYSNKQIAIMKVSFENVSKVQGLLTVSLERADYQESLEKSLKEYRKKANMPGFRPGMVPMALIQKMYGKAIKAEEINRILQDKVMGYIKDNNIDMLGEPLPNDEKEKGQSMDDDNLTFYFDIAVAPEFDATVSKDDTLTYYQIKVTDEMVDGQVNSYTQRNGKYEKVDSYQANDMMKGKLAELNADGSVKDGGIVVEDTALMPSYFADDSAKSLFEGAKTGTEVRFNPAEAYKNNAVQLSSLLARSKEEVENVKSDFLFTISEITRYIPGDVNQELFDQVFGKDAVKSEKEFRDRIRESLERSFVPDSDYRFLLDVRKYLTDRIGKLEYPEVLLKRILRENSREENEDIDATYQRSIDELTWHLIKERLVRDNDIRIEEADVKEQAREATRAQFAQYGMMEIPEELLNNYAGEMMKKRETVDGLVNRAVETKLSAVLKKQFTLKKKNVSMEDFNKLFETDGKASGEKADGKKPAKATAKKSTGKATVKDENAK